MKARRMVGAGRCPPSVTSRASGRTGPPGPTVATLYAFECPHCGERTVVDGAVRNLLVAEGCVGCGRSVTAEAFARR